MMTPVVNLLLLAAVSSATPNQAVRTENAVATSEVADASGTSALVSEGISAVKTHADNDFYFLLGNVGVSLLSTMLPGVGCLIAPLAHGLSLKVFGDNAKREYPMWWLGIVGGYGVYLLGTLATLGAAYGAGLVIGGPAANSTTSLGSLGTSMLLGYVIGLVGFGVTVFVAAPVVDWWLGTMGAQDIDAKTISQDPGKESLGASGVNI